MMSQFSQDTDPWNSSGHFPSSFQPTWGECQRFTALDWWRVGYVPDGEQSILGHCPSQATLRHCPPQTTFGHSPSQGYSLYPIEAPPGHSPCGLGSTQLATPIGALSPGYQANHSYIPSGESLNQSTFQSVWDAQPDYQQISHPQQSTPFNTHFQNEFQQEFTNHLHASSSLSSYTDQDTNFQSLPKYLSFDPSKSKWSDFYRKFEHYAKDKHWSSQECMSNLKYVLQGKAADYLAYLNELVPNLPYYDLIMQMEQHMESQDLIDPQFNQLHHQRTFDIDCSYTSTPNSQNTCYQPSAYHTQAVGTQHLTSFPEPHWQSQGKFLSYRGSHNDTLSSFDFSGDNAMVHGPFQNGEMLSRGVPALEEMACLEHLPCDTLDMKEQFVSFQVPPVAEQNGESSESQIGRGGLHRGSCHDSSYSEHQIELEEICLPSKTRQNKGLKSERIIAINKEEGLVFLKSKSRKSARELPAEQWPNIASLLPFPEKGKGIQIAHRNSMSVEEAEELLWPEHTELQLVQGNSSEIHPEIQESKSEITDFWWDSMSSSELGSRDKRDSTENCEDYIDFMYGKLCGTLPLSKEIPSTIYEDEEWIDRTFKEMQIQPYSAWNPSMSLDGDLSTVQLETNTGDSYYQKKQESSSIAGMEQMTSSQISSNKHELSSEATPENKLEPVNNLKAFQFQAQSTEVDQVPMTSQSSSNKQELSSEATLENEFELVTNLKAYQFQGKSTEVDQAQTASQISSNKLELSSEAMPKMTLELVDSLNVSLQFQGQNTEVEKEQRENITASQMRSNKQELCSEATSNSTDDDQKSFILQVRHEAMYPEGTENKVASPTDNDTNQLELDSEATCNTNHYSSLADQLGNPAGEEQDPGSDSMSTWEDITICQLPSSSMLSVPVSLQDVKLLAVIDTAAEVTIISDSIFRELQPTPPYLKKVILHTTGRDLRMGGFVVGPVALKLGEITFPEAVYVAPIQDDMLLGLDFLLRHGVDIKLNDRCLAFRGKGQKVPIEVERMGTSKESQVKKVTLLEKTVKVPPNTVLRLQCKISDSLNDNIIEPEGDLDVILPRSLHSAGSKPKVCLVNVTDSLVRLRQKQLVAKVFPVCTASLISVDDTWQYGLYVSADSTRAYSISVNVKSFQKVEDGGKWPWDPGGC